MLRSQHGMPEICRFYGIVIRMYFMDYAPPHYRSLKPSIWPTMKMEPCSRTQALEVSYGCPRIGNVDSGAVEIPHVARDQDGTP